MTKTPTIAPTSGASESTASQRKARRQVAALAEDEVDRVQPIGEVVGDDREEDEEARCRVELEGQPDAEAVDEAVQREPGRAEGADLRVRLRLLRLVAMMQDE